MFKKNNVKYTCSCCGYKTLNSNAIGELCPVCGWEEDYFEPDNLFIYSSANHKPLFLAQENYIKFGCYDNNFASHCREPQKDEEKDQNWASIHQSIKNKYQDNSSIIHEIYTLAEFLKQPNSRSEYYNFRTLKEEDIKTDYEEIGLDYIEFGEMYSAMLLDKKLFLKALTKTLAKKDERLLLEIIVEYFTKGINYYITWSIMIIVLIEIKPYYTCQLITDILVEIERENYYGLSNLERVIKSYWLGLRK